MNTYLKYLILWVITFITVFITALILTFNFINSIYIALIDSIISVLVSAILINLLSKIRIHQKAVQIIFLHPKQMIAQPGGGASSWTSTQFENASITAAVVFVFTLFMEMEYHGGTISYDNLLVSLVPAAIAGITVFATQLGIQLPTTPPPQKT
ncbi:MAG: hypothetical protein QW046_01945 [Candidatus Micrarchaeaceae archaeon]